MSKTVSMLTGTRTHEVSVVDRGAVRRVFSISKAEYKMKNLEAVLETAVEGESSLVDVLKSSEVSEKGLDAAVGVLRLLKSFKEELTEDAVQAVAKEAGYELPQEEAQEEIPVVKAEDLPEQYQAVFKANELRAQKAEKDLEEIRKNLAVERDARLASEFKEKAEKFPLVGSADELGALLKDIATENAELEARVTKALETVQERLAQAPLLKEIGSEGDDDASASAWDTIQKRAAELVKKGEFATKELAVTHVMKADRELVRQYRAEKGA